ncbi:MAG: 30S ribosomal protein S5 [Candidatus Peregrinibacteria bacterium]|nr:30S ribosomal protein S5 [Candidatus Peregrinibacteria bacterium]
MNAKTSRPDRRKHGRDNREPSEFAEVTLSVDRVTRVVKGGRRMRFRAIVVIGNRKGKVGLGTGKAAEVQAAVKKATAAAKRKMIRVPLTKGTIPHPVDMKFKAARIRLLPAMEGTGIIAGGALRVILDHAGVKNVLSKRYGTRNKLVNAQAVMIALQMLREPTKKMMEAEEKEKAEKAVKDGELAVKEVSRGDVTAEGTLKAER